MGSTMLLSDLDIFRPSEARTSPWMTISRKGASPANSIPIFSMRATQKKMMS